MDECEHYTIRRDVAKHREKDPRVNYPFMFSDQEQRLKQLKSLLPYMSSSKCKQWDCQHCLREFMDQDCPHGHSSIEARPSVSAPSLEAVVVTNTNTEDSTMDKINVDTPGSVRINALEVLICTDIKNSKVEKKPSSETKVFFDLNKAPVPETRDEALEKHIYTSTTSESGNAELVSVSKLQAGNLKDKETVALSSKVPNYDIGNALGENLKNRTIDFSCSLTQNYQLPGSPRRSSNGKRKNQPSHDQNGNSEAVEAYSSKGLQKETRRIPQLKKRRFFGGVGKTLPVVDSGNSRPARNKKATGKAAIYQLILGSKLKNKDCKESSRITLDKNCFEKSSSAVVDRELVLQDRHILATSEDILIPCVDDDKLKLSELVSQIRKKKLLGRGVSHKRLEVYSPSANKIQNGTSSIQFKKSSGKAPKKRGRKREVLKSGASSIDAINKGDKKRTASVKNELVPREGSKATVIPVLPSEDALQLLSMVASQYMQFDAISDNGLDCTTDPVTEEFHTLPASNVLELGYGGCIEVTNPAEYFLVESEGDRFKLGPENLPLRPHRMLQVQRAVPIRSVGTRHQLLRKEDHQWANAAAGTPYVL